MYMCTYMYVCMSVQVTTINEKEATRGKKARRGIWEGLEGEEVRMKQCQYSIISKLKEI